MSWTKYALFCVISLSIAMAVLELFSFGLFLIHDKSKSSEVFAVRDFTYPVDDGRFYSMKKDFSIVNTEACETKIETNPGSAQPPPHAPLSRSDLVQEPGLPVFCIAAKVGFSQVCVS